MSAWPPPCRTCRGTQLDPPGACSCPGDFCRHRRPCPSCDDGTAETWFCWACDAEINVTERPARIEGSADRPRFTCGDCDAQEPIPGVGEEAA